jgi:hypothetical protein
MPKNHKTLSRHIGSEKTGTTAIQRALTTYSKALRKFRGVYYPVRTPLFLDHAHFPLVGAFLEAEELNFVPPSCRLSLADVTQCLQLLGKENKGHSLILSAEHFSSRLPFAKLALLKNVLKEALPDYAIKIIYHVRSQPSVYCSRYSTSVRNFEAAWPRPRDINGEDRYYNFFNVAFEWAREFGRDNIEVLDFHSSDAISLFSAAAAIELPASFASSKGLENASLSYEECELLRLFNAWFEPLDFKSYEGIDSRVRLRDLFLRHVENIAISRTPTEATLTEADLEHFLCEFRESNDRLQSIFNLDFNLNAYVVEMAARAREKTIANGRPRSATRPLLLELEGTVRRVVLGMLLELDEEALRARDLGMQFRRVCASLSWRCGAFLRNLGTWLRVARWQLSHRFRRSPKGSAVARGEWMRG